MGRIEQLASLGAHASMDSFEAAWRIVQPMLLTMTLGSVPLGAITAVAVYAIARRAIGGPNRQDLRPS